MSRYVRKILLNIPPYIPGRSVESIQKQFGILKIHKLASNENPLGPSPKALETIKQHLKNINRYPDSDAGRLKNRLAEKFNLCADNFLIGNGATEIIDLLALAFINPGDQVLLSCPTFPKYSQASRRVMGDVVQIRMKNFRHDVKELLKNITSKTKIVFIDNPGNPSGNHLSRKEQEEILASLPGHVILIFDEAYREFNQNSECLDYKTIVPGRKNVVFLRSFSKGYGLAGMRVGYAVGDPEIIRDINRVREVFNVNSLALAAAESALDDKEHLNRSLETNKKGKEYLYHHLERLGYEFFPSFTNFILINTSRELKVVDEFLLKSGIIIRPIKLPNFSEGYIRVSIGRAAENTAFIEAMERLKILLPESEQFEKKDLIKV